MSPAVSSDSRKRSADEAELDKGQVEFEVEKQIEKKEKGAAGGVVGWDKSISLDRLRADIRSFAAERDWEKFQTPRNLLLALVGEVGEAAEIFQVKYFSLFLENFSFVRTHQHVSSSSSSSYFSFVSGRARLTLISRSSRMRRSTTSGRSSLTCFSTFSGSLTCAR